MKQFLLLLSLALPLWSQATVYLRSSGPASVIVNGATNATPIAISTNSPHNFSSACGTSATCYCGVWTISAGTGVSPANGIHECHYVDPTHLSLYDLTNTAIAGTGQYWTGGTMLNNPSGAWVSQLTPFTLGSGPLGYLDGPNGNLMRRVSLGPQNGMTTSNGLVVSGCPAACSITVATTYDPTTGLFPIAAGNSFSVTGTGTALDTCGSGGAAQSPYTVVSASSFGWASASFTCTGLSNADYTNVNLHCGPAATPNDTIGGTQPCTRVSQMAYTGNPWWNALTHQMVHYSDFTSYPSYLMTYDGGTVTPGSGILQEYSLAALRFLVDPASSLFLQETLYALNHIERIGGVSFAQNEAAGVFRSNEMYTDDYEGLSILYDVGAPYWTASEKATGLNKLYNDLDDPTVAACSKTNADMSTGHTIVLSSGLVASGTNDATHVQLPVSDPHYGTVNYYVNTVVQLSNGGFNAYSNYSYGLVTAQTSGGVLTVSFSSGGYAQRNNVTACTYTSGLSVTGTTGQLCALNMGNAQGAVPLTGANTIAGSTTIAIWQPGSGFVSAPTAASVYGNSSSASCSGSANVSCSIGTSYAIYDTAVVSTTTQGVAATYIFTKTTNLSSYYNSGDGIMGYNGWGNNFHLWNNMSYVTSVGSNTLSVVNGGGVTASTSVPSMAWHVSAWQAGDCGLQWAFKHFGPTSYGVVSAVYPPITGVPVGTDSGGNIVPNAIISEGGNFGAGDPGDALVADLAIANDDSRAIRDAARMQSYLFDYEHRHYMDYSGGWVHSGTGYSIDSITGSLDLQTWMLSQSIPGFPNEDLTGPWLQGTSLQKMFEYYPDLQGGLPNFLVWGGGVAYAYDAGGVLAQGFPFDGALLRAPQSNNAKFLRNWMEHVTDPCVSIGTCSGGTTNYWGGNGVEGDRVGLAFLHNDPRVGDVDYTTQPHQYVWNTSSSATCASLTGWPCSQFRGDAMISRTGWTSSSDSLLYFDSRAFTTDYDAPNGSLRLYKNGWLLAPDTNPPGSLWVTDSSIIGDTPQFGGAQSRWDNEFLSGLGSTANVGKIQITAWGGTANSGSWSTQYGDAQSRYAYVCTNLAPEYNTSNLGIAISYVNRCAAHFKESGKDEFVFDLLDTSNSSTQVATHIHYNQTGQTISGGMVTGSTTCINSSGSQVSCSSTLNTNRIIKSLESGGGTPAEINGVITHVDSPGTITLNWDCPGSGNAPQCTNSPLNTYSGGNGWTDRVTIAGGSSVGASVTGMTALIEHKVMQSLTDATFSTTALNPDANWTGAQVCGAVSCAVFVGAVGGTTHSTLTSFITTHTGIAQYLIGGLAAGNYIVKVNGTTVFSGSVAAGDNSVAFDSTAGTVVISVGVGGTTVIGGNGKIGGNGIIH